MDRESRDGDAPSPSPERQPSDTGTIRATHSRRAVGIVTDAAGPAGPGASMDMNSDPHIVINDEGVVTGVGVEDGIVSLETNDDFATDAPPGAPGALDDPSPTARTVTNGHASTSERSPVWARRTSPSLHLGLGLPHCSPRTRPSTSRRRRAGTGHQHDRIRSGCEM